MGAESIRIVDVDQHYYEPDDCFTRHLAPAFAEHALRVVVNDEGRPEWRFGDRPLAGERYPRTITIGPGELERSLSAREQGTAYSPTLIDGTAPEYTDRTRRLALMDEWGIDATAKPSLAGYTPRHRVPPEVWERLDLKDYVE